MSEKPTSKFHIGQVVCVEEYAYQQIDDIYEDEDSGGLCFYYEMVDDIGVAYDEDSLRTLNDLELGKSLSHLRIPPAEG